MTESEIVPEEVRRLRLEPGDRLIVRVADRWTPQQIHEYQDYLRTAFPDNDVLVIVGEQVLTAGPGDRDVPDSEIAGIVTIGFGHTGDLASFASLEVHDAHSGESLVGLTGLRLKAEPGNNAVTAEITEVVGESGNPIRQHNNREKAARSEDGRSIKTVTRTFLVAPHRLGGDDERQ